MQNSGGSFLLAIKIDEGPRRMPSRPVPSRQQARPKFEDAPASVAAGRVAGTLARHFASLRVLPTDCGA
jgi:hypothetical protein